MVQYCVAYGCKNLHDKRFSLQFHSFPFKRPEILKLWVTAIRRENWYPSKGSRLCGEHFKSTDYQNNKKRLKLDAVPSMFNFPRHLQKNEKNRKVLVRNEISYFNSNHFQKQYALEQPRLSKDAVPTIFSNYQLENSDGDTYCQPEMIKLEPLVIEDIKIEDGEPIGIKIEAEDDSSPSRMIKLEPEIIDLKTETEAFECHCSFFEKLWNKELEISLPSDSWAIQNIKNTNYKKFISVSQMVCVEGKTVSVVGKQIMLSENTLTFYVFNSLITDIFPEKEVHSLEELWNIIIRFDQMQICHGGMLITKAPQNFKNPLYFKDPVLEKWRHKMCKYVIVDNKNIDDTKCFFCKKIRKSVWYFKMKVEPCKMPKVKLLQRRCNNLQKKEKRLKMRFREIYEELKLARKTIREYSFTDNLET